jgi:sulfoxide reductase heme-binding subunit YedZ
MRVWTSRKTTEFMRLNFLAKPGPRGWSIGLLSLLPLIYLGVQVYQLQSGVWDILGPEPGRAMVFYLGDWALYFMVGVLAVSTLRRRLGWNWLMRHRRMIGLYAFSYVCLHMLAYFTFLLEWDWGDIASEVIERQYLLFGMLCWLCLLPLALTSTKGWMRRLGRHWKRLHSLVYFAALLVAFHYLLQIRSNWFEPVFWSLVIGALLIERRVPVHRKRSPVRG